VTPASLFLYVFGVIFLAELPDKTALAALVLATRHKPAPVFVGTALGLAVQSAVAVLAGGLFGLLPARPVHIVAGAVFVVSAVVMWRQKEEEEAEKATHETEGEKKPTSFFKVAALAFWVIFAAEWGDLTQIGTAALAARYSSPLIVFSASTLALCAAAGVAITVGNRAARVLKPAIMQRVAAVLFGLVGVALATNLI
jgi:Ca2+/H+ antiporter, TMEM165/GDT1 family